MRAVNTYQPEVFSADRLELIEFKSMKTSLLAAALMVGTCAAQSPPVPAAAEAYKALPSEVRDGKLKPGDPAMDFTLKLRHSGKSVTLSSYKGKRPVALVFGSYT